MTTDPFALFEDVSPDYYVGQRVDLFRRARKMQQKELALAAGMTQATLSRKINGATPWGLDEALRIANALGVTVADLTEGVERTRVLPHLDSNQEPSDYRLAQVRALPGRHLRLVG